jgi:hypothetical protein
VPIERQISEDAFELAVFVAQRSEFAQIGQAEARELLLPPVEGLLADAEPAADLGDFLVALICSLLRPLLGMVYVSLAGTAGLVGITDRSFFTFPLY